MKQWYLQNCLIIAAGFHQPAYIFLLVVLEPTTPNATNTALNVISIFFEKQLLPAEK
jgi:hypothetical protein